MKRPALVSNLRKFLNTFAASQSGATAAMVAVLFMPLFIGMMALVYDLNNARQVQERLQASADAAALAASMDIGSTTTDPLSTATTYSSDPSLGRNPIPGISNFTLSMTRKCLTQTTFGTCLVTNNTSSGGLSSINAILITETARVGTVFSRYFGLNAINISVQAEAAGHGGGAKPLDVVVLVDTTASMNSEDDSCSTALAKAKPSKLDCAKLGLRNLLSQLNAQAASVAVMTFPGFSNSSQANYDTCKSTSGSPQVAPYSSANSSQSWFYLVSGLSKNYQSTAATPSTPATLNGSDAVGAASGASSSCGGLQAIGGVGTYYSDAITAAINLLNADTSSARKVVIMLSDGDASATQANVGATKHASQCMQAVNTAKAATNIEFYTIGYGASNSGCSTDNSSTLTDTVTGNTGPCAALARIATNAATYFFYDKKTGGSSSTTSGSSCVGGNPITSTSGGVAAALGQIGTELQAAVLIPVSSV